MHDWYVTPYVLISAFSGVVSLFVAWYMHRRRHVHGAMAFSLLMLAVSVWGLANTAEHLSQTIALKLLFSKLSYFGVVAVSPLWMLFVLHYVHPGVFVRRHHAAALFLLPCLILFLTLSNEWHGLIWPAIHAVQTEPNLLLRYDHGPGVWILAVYSYSLLGIGTMLFLRGIFRMPRLFRIQIAFIIVAVISPWIGSILYLTRTVRWSDQDLTPIGFALTGIIMVFALFRYHFLDILPVARDTVIEHMSDGVLVLDSANRIVDVNPAMTDILGAPSTHLIGKQAASVIPECRDLLLNVDTLRFVQDEVTFDDSTFHDIRIKVLLDHHGHAAGRLIIIRDISDRKRADAELLRYTKELEAGNAELDAFADTVAHDLRNPLSTMIGVSDLLSERQTELTPEEMVEHITLIQEAGRKMNAIIQALLLLASIRRAEHIPRETVNMGDVLHEAMKGLYANAQERGITIEATPSWPAVTGYAPWLENVWVNYISNALKYGCTTEDRRITLGFDEIADDRQEPMLRFWVRDYGRGLTEEECGRLFTPFTRLHLHESEGHGLGLSIVQRIIERLGGTVGVDSTPGQGSTFWFTLPRAQ
jgi:PAS domain S-box-containing protein